MTINKDAERRAFEEQIERSPLVRADQSRWPKHVRSITLEETDGLGIDAEAGSIGTADQSRSSAGV